jgi:hypothetical protein
MRDLDLVYYYIDVHSFLMQMMLLMVTFYIAMLSKFYVHLNYILPQTIVTRLLLHLRHTMH